MTALILAIVILALGATAVGLIARRRDAGAALVALVVMMTAAIVAIVYAAMSGE
jgi:hypothetical protein